MAICSECGTNLVEDAAFCPNCGASVTGGGDLHQGSAPQIQKTIQDQSKSKAIPVFTPPTAPTFTPPQNSSGNGTVCFHHPNESAAAQCARCGKYICKDCVEAYGVSSGEYAGKCLCFDCCQELVADNVSSLQRNYAEIKKAYTLCLVGVVIGAVVGFVWGASSSGGAALIMALFCACIGGGFSNFIKRYVASIPGFFVSTGNFVVSLCIGLIKFMACFFIYGIMAVFETIRKIVFYVNYMKRTSGFIESDQAALEQMKAYMEYTLVRSNNRGVDLDSLMKEGSQLYNNSYAQAVMTQGEAAADAALRQATTRIAENGEIIREFQNAA